MIVSNLGGAIDLATSEGEGTTFSVYLPALPAAVAAKSALPNDLQRDVEGRTILIADDEVAVATIMREMLESAGYRARIVASGLEALAVAAQIEPDLVVLDLMMPGGSGPETVAQFHERFPQTPVVLISGLSAEEIAEAAPGATAFLEKPFTHFELLRAVHNALL